MRKGHHLPLWIPQDLWQALLEYCELRTVSRTQALLQALRAFLGVPDSPTHQEAVQAVRERLGYTSARVATCPRGMGDCETFDSDACGGCDR